jgi:hypothetical protein
MDVYQKRLAGVLMLGSALLGVNAVLIVPTLVGQRAVPDASGDVEAAWTASLAPSAARRGTAAGGAGSHIACCFGAAAEDSPSSMALHVPVSSGLIPIPGALRPTIC